MRRLLLIPLALLAANLAACGSDEKVGHGDDVVGGPAPVVFEFTQDLGCGYGFARTNDDATQLLQVFYDGDRRSLDGAVALPDPHWTATIETGKHLDANWCNDVIIDPQPTVEETWTVVAGTLTFRDGPPHVDGKPNDEPVRAELTGVVVESPDGDQVDVGDVSLRNVSFGLFAG